MDLREHSLALISVIVGLGLTDLLGRFARLMRARRQVQWYWVSLAWGGISLVLVVNFWWGIYLGSVSLTQASSAAQFLMNLANPVLLYLICAGALPDARTQGGMDLRTAYYDERTYFFGLLVAYLLTTYFQAVVANASAMSLGMLTALRVLLVALVLPLVWVRSPRYHALATAVFAGLMVIRMFTQVLK
jgi:hypothetical protein